MTKVFLTIPNCELSYYKGYIPAIASAKLIKKNNKKKQTIIVSASTDVFICILSTPPWPGI